MIKYDSAVLFCKDVRASHAFYGGVLGLETKMDNGGHVAYVCGLSIWDIDMAHGLVFGEKRPSGGGDFELCFVSDDIMADYNRLKGDAKVLTEPVEQPWGQFVFRLSDPDGYVVEFGERLSSTLKRLREAGFSDEEIEKKCHAPVEILEKL